MHSLGGSSVKCSSSGYLKMADPKKALPTNINGNFFVDSTCIDCDTCRQLAPETFVEEGNYSAVFHQPVTDIERVKAIQALVSCPTASIGTREKTDVRKVIEDFPLLLAADVYYCGFNSSKSYGGNSFFITHPDGNWLIDSPRYVSHLANRFKELGGVKYIFLTHRDDVADAEQYAENFGAQRIIHSKDASAAPGSEIVLEGTAAIEFTQDFKLIPTPGHTAGHAVLLFAGKYLFTGDHLAFDREAERLTAFRDHCWYSWAEQTTSMEALLDYSFEYVLAGHGDRVKLPANVMREQLENLVSRMKLPTREWQAA